METPLQKIGEVIVNVAKNENAELKTVANKGIFFMPELAFAYACGKTIMEKYDYVFDGHRPEWKREVDLGNGGPTDLVFECPSSKNIAIEFKVSGKGYTYINDIEKLLRLDSANYTLAFCALIDVFTSKALNDERIHKVTSYPNANIVSIVEPKPQFVTWCDTYSSEISCAIGFWAINI